MKNKLLNLNRIIAACALLGLSLSITQCKKDLEKSNLKAERLSKVMSINAVPKSINVDPNNYYKKNTDTINKYLNDTNVSKLTLNYTSTGWKVGKLIMNVEGQELHIAGNGLSPGKLIAGEETTAINDPFYAINSIMIKIEADGCIINGYSNGSDTTAGIATIQMTKYRYDSIGGFTASEGRHIISTSGKSNITIKGLLLKNPASDGIYLGSGAGTPTNIDVTDVTVDGATRNGLTIIEGDQIDILRSEFINTAGSYQYIKADGPFSGVDIEPNSVSDMIKLVTFRKCLWSGNQSHQLQIGLGKLYGATPITDSLKIRFYGCTVVGGSAAGIKISGLKPTGPVGSLYFQDLVVKNIPSNAIYINTWAADRARLLFNDVEIRNTATLLTSSAPIKFDHNQSYKGGDLNFQKVYVDDSMNSHHQAILLGDGSSQVGFKDITGTASATTPPAFAIKLNSTQNGNAAYTGIIFKNPTPSTSNPNDNVTITATKVTY